MKRQNWLAALAVVLLCAGIGFACSKRSDAMPGTPSASGMRDDAGGVFGEPNKEVVWSGTAQEDGNSIPIEFVIVDDGTGALSGYQVFFDPETNAAIKAGAISGQRNGSHVEWRGQGGLLVEGRVNGTKFVGSVTFPAARYVSMPARTVPLTLTIGDEP